MTAQEVEESTSPKQYPRGAKGDRNALVGMQRVLWRKVQDKSTPSHIVAQCARAWRDLQDMKRIMDGKPLPGQLRPDGNALPFLDRRKRKPVAPPIALPELAPPEDSRTAQEKSQSGVSLEDRPSPPSPTGDPPAL